MYVNYLIIHHVLIKKKKRRPLTKGKHPEITWNVKINRETTCHKNKVKPRTTNTWFSPLDECLKQVDSNHKTKLRVFT